MKLCTIVIQGNLGLNILSATVTIKINIIIIKKKTVNYLGNRKQFKGKLSVCSNQTLWNKKEWNEINDV